MAKHRMNKAGILTLALALTLLLAACGGQSAPAANSSAAQSEAAAAQTPTAQNQTPAQPDAAPAENAAAAPKHLNAAIYWSAATLDPAVDYDGWTTCRAGITETLVMVDENLELVPLLSDTWEQTDETTWVMHIRDGVTFHNGKSVDAAAVKACFERTMEMQDRAVTACKIDSIEADGQSLTIKTSEPFGAFLANLSEPLYSVIDVDAGTDPATAPVATGPFMVTGFKAEDVIELAAYPGYWNGPSDLDTVTVKTITDNSTRAMALQSGEIDIAQRVNNNDIDILRADPNYAVYETAGTRIQVLILNHANEFLSDYNVRKALECSLNYEALVKIMGGSYTLAGAPYPSSAPYGYDQLDVQHYDAAQAKSLLAEAGWADSDGNGYVEKNGKELSLTLTYNDAAISAAMEAVQAMAGAVGIRVNLDLRDSTGDIDSTRDFEMLVRNWQSLSTGDPQWLLDTMYKSGAMTNLGSYSNLELDKICDELSNAFDFASRQKLTVEAEKIILADCVNINLFGQNNYVIASAKVENVKPFPIDYYFIDNTTSITG